MRYIPTDSPTTWSKCGFLRASMFLDVATQPQPAGLLSWRTLAIIENKSLDRICLFSTKGFGHAVSKNDCNLGDGHLFNICI